MVNGKFGNVDAWRSLIVVYSRLLGHEDVQSFLTPSWPELGSFMAHIEHVGAVMGDDVLPLAVTWIRESEHRLDYLVVDGIGGYE